MLPAMSSTPNALAFGVGGARLMAGARSWFSTRVGRVVTGLPVFRLVSILPVLAGATPSVTTGWAFIVAILDSRALFLASTLSAMAVCLLASSTALFFSSETAVSFLLSFS